MAELARLIGLVRPARLALAFLGAALLALGGCAGEKHDPDRLTQPDLMLMLTMLPGRYDNSAQAQLDARNNVHPAHESVQLVVTHVYTPRLGHYVYYAQESALDDARRVLGQKMWSFELDEKRGLVQTLYELNEPTRWRDGYLNKDLFTSMQMEDVQPEGCRLIWKKKGNGFAATHDPKVCPDSAAVPAAAQMELSAGALAVGDYQFVRKGR
ncbi:MAG TPA: CpcT/CpeT family chromophore lyase [Steroidobacteraceae bacterium]|nr:CpcT/CpeT family chromophore lyase [Steroidobacteraceae bacterium]